jgi:hydroxylamine reductase (hybrid-cluster protein)
MKTRRPKRPSADLDTLRTSYDFSKAKRGVTAARYAQGTNVVLLDPDVAEVFPDTQAVNEALRTFARLSKSSSRGRARQKRTA